LTGLSYFAGHGLARDAGEDLWLLSQWLPDQRGLAVGSLRRKLERYASNQLTIIGDACRTLPDSPESADLVLGLGPFQADTPTIDILNASKAFRAAYMVPGQTPEEDRCIFSGVLQEALSGARAEAFDAGRITSSSLARFLKQEVQSRHRDLSSSAASRYHGWVPATGRRLSGRAACRSARAKPMAAAQGRSEAASGDGRRRQLPKPVRAWSFPR
jgi:hypothetical protein